MASRPDTKENMKTSILSAVAAAGLCAVLATSCADKGAKTLPEKGMSFVLGFDADFPPYGYKDGDEYKGFDLDLAREVCKRNDWTFVPKPINWDAKDMELNSGAICCIWNGFTINGRESAYEWTEPYVDNSQVVLVKAGSPVKTLADLAGKTVAVQTDTPVQKALAEGGDREELGKTFKSVLVTPNYNNAVMELDSGAVDAVALDVGVARQKMLDMPGKFEMLDETVMTEKYGIGFKLGNVELRDAVQKTLKEMVADGTAAAISREWFDGKDVLVLKP